MRKAQRGALQKETVMSKRMIAIVAVGVALVLVGLALVLQGGGVRERPDSKPLVHESIHKAAAAWELADVKRHLRKGVDLNISGQYDDTPLHRAAVSGQKDIVAYLASKGANMNARGNLDNTPLQEAMERGHTEVVELLRAYGARPQNTPVVEGLDAKEKVVSIP